MAYKVGITGGSGSGKTYFVRRLMEKLGNETAVIISQDNYYLPKHLQPLDPNGIPNFDLPQSVDIQAMVADVAALCHGKTITLTEYTFNNPAAKPARQLICNLRPIVIVEGLFVLYHPELEASMDLKIFIDAPDHIKLRRRIVRDQLERGYDLADILYRFEHHVMPSFRAHIEPLKSKAHLVVNNESDCRVALEVVANHLRFHAKLA